MSSISEKMEKYTNKAIEFYAESPVIHKVDAIRRAEEALAELKGKVGVLEKDLHIARKKIRELNEQLRWRKYPEEKPELFIPHETINKIGEYKVEYLVTDSDKFDSLVIAFRPITEYKP